MKKALSVLLVFVLVLSVFAGCKSKKNDDDTTAAPIVPAGDTTAPSTTMTPVADDGMIAFANVSITETDGESNAVITPVNGLSVLLAVDGSSVCVTKDTKLTAVFDENGKLCAVKTAEGAVVAVVEENGVLKAESGNADDVATTLAADGSTVVPQSSEAQSSSSANKPATTKKPSNTKKPSTTKKPAADNSQALKDYIENTGMTEEEKKIAYDLVKLLDYRMDENGTFYTDKDPWQRQFGFNAAYDFGAQYVMMNYDTVRVKFTYGYYYNADGSVQTDANGNPVEKQWMIQTWKGRYGAVFLGCEIGVYTKPSTRKVEHYDCADDNDLLYMDMSLYQTNMKTNETQKLFSREPDNYWWCTGFVPGAYHEFENRDELTMIASIRFKDDEMAKLFTDGLDKVGFKEGAPGMKNVETYSRKGATVKISWRYLDVDAKS